MLCRRVHDVLRCRLQGWQSTLKLPESHSSPPSRMLPPDRGTSLGTTAQRTRQTSNVTPATCLATLLLLCASPAACAATALAGASKPGIMPFFVVPRLQNITRKAFMSAQHSNPCFPLQAVLTTPCCTSCCISSRSSTSSAWGTCVADQLNECCIPCCGIAHPGMPRRRGSDVPV